ncbi:hypothetical protein V6N13_037416 [Hibiscus sabdariffa]
MSELQELAKEFYQNLFTSSLEYPLFTTPHGRFLVLDDRYRDSFLSPVSMEEVRRALFSQDTNFWCDPWLDDVEPLIDYNNPSVASLIAHSSVAPMVDSVGQWRWSLIEHLLPQDILLRVAAVKGPDMRAPADEAGWRGGKNRVFAIKSTYLMQDDDTPSNPDPVWSVIQKFRDLPHVKSFLWLLCWRKLMRNVERSNRHFTLDCSCAVCGFVCEDVDHIFKQCSPARQVW